MTGAAQPYVDPFARDVVIAGRDNVYRSPVAPLFENEHVRELRDPTALPVLALDLGNLTGYAYRTSACVTSGTMNWSLRRGETHGMRLLRIWRWLHRIHEATPLALIAYERVAHMGPRQMLAAHAWAQYQGVVEMFAARKEIPIRSVHTGTLKKAITGRGSFKKTETQTASEIGKSAMMASAMAAGYAPTSYDEADALGVLIWCIR